MVVVQLNEDPVTGQLKAVQSMVVPNDRNTPMYVADVALREAKKAFCDNILPAMQELLDPEHKQPAGTWDNFDNDVTKKLTFNDLPNQGGNGNAKNPWARVPLIGKGGDA